MIGYKACLTPEKDKAVLVELEIPEDAVMFAFSDDIDKTIIKGKRRCNKAIVKKIHGGYEKVYSLVSVENWFEPEKYGMDFEYVVGKTMEVKDFLNSGLIQCAPGIHFFENKEDLKEFCQHIYVGKLKIIHGFEED